MTDLLVGLVSHPTTRFVDSQGTEGFPARLAKALEKVGVEVAFEKCVLNLLDPTLTPMTKQDVRASHAAQLAIRTQWNRYIIPGSPTFRRRSLRLFKRLVQHVSKFNSPPVSAIERLLNIELAHLHLMRSGLDANAQWILILEDDAFSPDVGDCALGISGIITETASDSHPSYVSLSNSFSLEELRVDALMSPTFEHSWNGNVDRVVMEALRPVTNTVCANLYRRSFVEQLVEHFDSLPFLPAIPIDWKLNQVVMKMFEQDQIADCDCWFVEPAPIDQRSMAPGTK